MRLIGLAVILALSLFAAPLAAEAQPAGKAPQVGVLLLDTEARGLSQRARNVVEGLRERSEAHGRNR